jgi:hypothetical protein
VELFIPLQVGKNRIFAISPQQQKPDTTTFSFFYK